MKQSVLEVHGVLVDAFDGDVKQCVVRASGIVRSLGWTDAALVLREGVDDAGALHVDFVATPPASPSGLALTPIDAVAAFAIARDVRHVVVHARANERRERLGLAAAMRTLSGGGGDSPSPFVALRPLGGGGGDMPTPFVVGIESRLDDHDGVVVRPLDAREREGVRPHRVSVVRATSEGDRATPFRLTVTAGGGEDSSKTLLVAELEPGRGVALPCGEGPSWLVGMKLRVVRPGDSITGEYDVERISLYVDDAGRIAQITFG